ncbi:MAG: hypothetical protein LC785_00195 [Acidobacteria bacterium]|nr:hypothetical protein [Acidobacteriota bacterium]MCA1640415.1 hypothetical protein [Acidobacteriota bacterium]
MSKFRFTLTAFAVMAFIVALSSGAQAQATRTWVSGVGDDVNPCSRTAPCKTYAGAISKTAVHGEISTLDPGGFGAITITKSITIEGTQGQGYGSILHSATNGVTIAFDNFTSVGESQKSVRLRNLNINGSGGSSAASSGLRGIRISGGAAAIGTEVAVEDCVIDGSFGNPGRGIEDFRQGGGVLTVNNTTVRNMAAAGIVVDPNAALNGASTSMKVSISNTRVSNCGQGMNFGSNVKAVISNSVISSIGAAGVFAIQNSAGTTEVSVDHCVISGNATGVNASTANTIIRVSNTTFLNNTTLFTTAGGGQVLSYGNNQANGAVLGTGVGPS